MSFVLPQGVRTFFSIDDRGRSFSRAGAGKRDGTPRFIMFDAYYCCLLLGLDACELGSEDLCEETKFLEAYPEIYKSQAELIAGLLVEAELRRLDIGPGDREDIEAKMVELLDLVSPTRLSAAGDRLLNRYAAAGFQHLRASMLPPDSLEEFLVGYHGFWDQEEGAD